MYIYPIFFWTLNDLLVLFTWNNFWRFITSFIILVLYIPTYHSQTTKGVVVDASTTQPANSSKGNVFAMVAGISNYPYVKPLNFAEEDALLFLEFLRSDAGGNVPENHIKLLLNEQATHANVTSGLSWLDKNTGLTPESGDRVYIYLSGHGDAYDASEAYYLCYDSNPAGDKNNYQLGGALDIGKMKKRLGAMVNKGVEVILIVDACRSGDVPGVKAGIGNPYQSVIEAPVGEILLLAAGPNQFALEDRRWGGGHGSFTWYLVKGLSGEADSDGDGMVQLFEIQNYTQMKVIGDTRLMGAPQTPYICCNGKFDFPLAKKDVTFAKRVLAEESGTTKVGLTAMAARDAMENAQFENEQLKQLYFDIKKKCQQQKYLGQESAWEIWELAKKNHSPQALEPVRMYLMGALAAEGQKAINEEMNTQIEKSPGVQYYKERRQWVEHAIKLQSEKNEVMGIEGVYSFLKALELSNSVSFAVHKGDSIMYTYMDQMFTEKRILPLEKADSIFKSLESNYANSAVYHFILQQQLFNRELYYLEDNANQRRKHLMKAMELAPLWAKPIITAIEMKLFSKEELDALITDRISKDSANADNYYLAFKHTNYNLSIDRNKALSYLEKAFYIRPSTGMMQRLLTAKFPHLFADFTTLLSADLSKVKKPTEADWKEVTKILSYYHSNDLHRIECFMDSTNLVRTMLPAIIGLAVKLNRIDDAKKILATEKNICPSYDGYMCEAILYKYIDGNEPNAQVDDLAAIRMPSGQTSLLNFYGIKKELMPKELQDRALYQSSKSIILLLFGKNDWIAMEKKAMDSLSVHHPEALKLNRIFGVILQKYLEKESMPSKSWNEQVEMLRTDFLPDYLDMIHWIAKYNGIMDSLEVFSTDEKLLPYRGLNLFIEAPVRLMEAADESSPITADSLLNLVYLSLGGDKTYLSEFLSYKKSNKVLMNTPTFQSIFNQPASEMDRLVAFQLYTRWELWDKSEEVFNTFEWQEPGKINPVVLATLTANCMNLTNYTLTEKYLNRLLPYLYNVREQDYSLGISIVIDFFFYRAPFLNNGIFTSPEFNRLYEKYVVD